MTPHFLSGGYSLMMVFVYENSVMHSSQCWTGNILMMLRRRNSPEGEHSQKWKWPGTVWLRVPARSERQSVSAPLQAILTGTRHHIWPIWANVFVAAPIVPCCHGNKDESDSPPSPLLLIFPSLIYMDFKRTFTWLQHEMSYDSLS